MHLILRVKRYIYAPCLCVFVPIMVSHPQTTLQTKYYNTDTHKQSLLPLPFHPFPFFPSFFLLPLPPAPQLHNLTPLLHSIIITTKAHSIGPHTPEAQPISNFQLFGQVQEMGDDIVAGAGHPVQGCWVAVGGGEGGGSAVWADF